MSGRTSASSGFKSESQFESKSLTRSLCKSESKSESKSNSKSTRSKHTIALFQNGNLLSQLALLFNSAQMIASVGQSEIEIHQLTIHQLNAHSCPGFRLGKVPKSACCYWLGFPPKSASSITAPTHFMQI